ncbi:MAG: acyl carrier protein [Myxococcota bacterium]
MSSQLSIPPEPSPGEKVRAFILKNFYVANASDLVDSASLLDGGIVDSTGILEIIMFLEEEFKLKVADAEMIPANLDSVDNLAAYVRRKLGW